MAAATPGGELIVRRIIDLWSGLVAENQTLREEAMKLSSKIKALQAETKDLKRQIAKLNKMTFGPSADHNANRENQRRGEEAYSSSDIVAVSGSAETEPPEPGDIVARDRRWQAPLPKPRNRQGRGVREFSADLERREIDMGTKDGLCPCGCGGGIRDYDVTETLEVIPARQYVAVRKYPKYRCRLENKIIGTPFLPKLFKQSTFSNSFLAEIITGRFHWYLPYHRQERILEAAGIYYSRSTMMRWVTRAAIEGLSAIKDLIERELKENSQRLFMDETPIPMLTPGLGKTRSNYLYALHRDDRSFGGNLPPIVVYYPRPTRAMRHIHEILADTEAIVQTDAYAGYGQLGKSETEVAGITPVKCWAHVRRKFTDEVEFNKTPAAQEIVDVIRELYLVEEGIRGKTPLVRKMVRRQASEPILERLRRRLDALKDEHLERSGMGKAIRYVLNHWRDLIRFVDDGRMDLDTNAVERMFKPTILLRKNALFMGSDEGAEAWAVISSIVETCKLNRVKVEPYLRMVLDAMSNKLPRSEYETLLPWNAPSEFRLLPQ